MGLFGGLFKVLKKVVGTGVQVLASKVTGGLSDQALKVLKGRGQVKAAAKTEVPTNQTMAVANKLKVPPAAVQAIAKVAREKAPPKPCAYGPRDPDGRCPPKPRAAPRARAARAERPCAYGPRVNGRCPPRPRTSLAQQRANRKTTQVFERIARSAVAPVLTAGVGLAGQPVGALLKGGAKKAAGLLGVVALAGLASYYVTTKILEAHKKKRLDRNEAAAVAADAYRAARLEAQRQQGGAPLSSAQHRALADAFKQRMAEIGLDTSNLRF